MGGIGSGTKSGMGTTTTEEHKRIDIRYLKQLGVLGNYCSGTLSWSCNGHQSGFIDYSSSPSILTLKYRFRWNGEDWQPVTQQVRFVETPCHYGGNRKWFLCPGCERRCGILYSGGPLFLCRTCYQIPYSSQTKGPIDRMILKKQKLEDKIFDDTGFRKRKGMHWSTFKRLLKLHIELEDHIDQHIYRFYDKHLEGIPRGGWRP